ncbi:MAG TPA: ribosome-binding factor A [bacterium]|nr:ribosome-binding factor A [bacterium]HPL95192.1 ribosome-binding factor A [bacterium]
MPFHQEKLNKLFLHELSEIIANYLEFPAGTLVTLMHVEVAKNLSQAKIWLSVLPFSKSAAAVSVLIKNQQLLVEHLNQRIKLRRLPKFIFLIDDTEEKAAAMEKQISKLFTND